jgi:hypothetical protein
MYIAKYSRKMFVRNKKIAKPARVGKLRLWTKLTTTCNMRATKNRNVWTKLTLTCNMRLTENRNVRVIMRADENPLQLTLCKKSITW